MVEWPKEMEVADEGWEQVGAARARAQAPAMPVASPLPLLQRGRGQAQPPPPLPQHLEQGRQEAGECLPAAWSGSGAPPHFSPGAHGGQAGTHSRQGTPADDGAAAGQARARAAEVMSGIRSSRQARQWSARMEGGRYSLSVAAISSLPDHFVRAPALGSDQADDVPGEIWLPLLDQARWADAWLDTVRGWAVADGAHQAALLQTAVSCYSGRSLVSGSGSGSPRACSWR